MEISGPMPDASPVAIAIFGLRRRLMFDLRHDLCYASRRIARYAATKEKMQAIGGPHSCGPGDGMGRRLHAAYATHPVCRPWPAACRGCSAAWWCAGVANAPDQAGRAV